MLKRSSPFAVDLLNPVAPTPTGSKTTGFLLKLAHFPAASIPSLSVTVPKLMRRPPGILARSSCSASAVAIMGLAPKANVAFALWLMTTLLVIW